MTWGRAGTAAGPKWKPGKCHDCGKAHPSFNRDAGKEGTPWRCAGCDANAEPMPAGDPFTAATSIDERQGSLL